MVTILGGYYRRGAQRVQNLVNQPRRFLVVLSVASVLGLAESGAQNLQPEQVLLNGKILTVDADFSIVEAVAIADERILAVGRTTEIASLAGPATRIVDLEGKTVIPGLIDNHSHMTSASRDWSRNVRLEGVRSREVALAAISAKAESAAPGEWIFALRGWSPGQFLDHPGPFTREELDQAAPDNPVLVAAGIDRNGTANSRALAAADIDSTDGRIDGAAAVNRIVQAAGEAGSWQEGLANLVADFVSVGLTTVYDPRARFSGQHTYYEPLERAYEDGRLPLRVFHSLNGQGGGDASRGAAQIADELSNTAPLQGNDELAQFGFGEDTLRVLRDTNAQPWQSTPQITADFLSVSMAAAQAGWQYHEHSHLEEKIRFVIDIYEQVDRTHPISDLRWTLHHATNLADVDIARLNALGVGVAIHSHGALQEGGSEREAALTAGPPAKALEEAGVVWGLGTDFGGPPITVFNPFITLGWAVTGQSLTGRTVMPDTVSREAALVAHTRSNAYLLHKEDVLGTLEPGKYADLIVLDRDYLTVPAADINRIRPLLTMVGGDVVFRADTD